MATHKRCRRRGAAEAVGGCRDVAKGELDVDKEDAGMDEGAHTASQRFTVDGRTREGSQTGARSLTPMKKLEVA